MIDSLSQQSDPATTHLLSPQRGKGKRRCEFRKPTRGKQNAKLKNSPPTIPNSDEGVFKAGEERSETRGQHKSKKMKTLKLRFQLTRGQQK